jgi:hypothetical protein
MHGTTVTNYRLTDLNYVSSVEIRRESVGRKSGGYVLAVRTAARSTLRPNTGFLTLEIPN